MKQFFQLIRFKSGKKCQKWISGGFKTDLLRPYDGTCTQAEDVFNFSSFIKSAGSQLTGLTNCERRLHCNSERKQYQSGDRKLTCLRLLSDRQLTAIRNCGGNLLFSSGIQQSESGKRRLTGFSLLNDRQLAAVKKSERSFHSSSVIQQNQEHDNDERREDDEGEKDEDFFKDGK